MIPALYPIMAGLDVHRASISAVILISRDPLKADVEVLHRQFSALQPGLMELRDWLFEHNCPIATMESASIYWKPPFAVLEEAGILPQVVNPFDVKAKRGKKTDKADALRIAHRAMHGLITPSFIPSPPIRELRLLTRARFSLMSSVRRTKNRITLLLDEGNYKFSVVATDLFGASGRKVLHQLAFTKNPSPSYLANLACGSLRKRIPELIPALSGNLNDTQRFLLQNCLAELSQTQQRLEIVEAQIANHIQNNDLGKFLVPLMSIPGIKWVAATTLLAEIGTTVAASFPSAKHFASWAGLCPGLNESAGKHRSGSIRKANRYLKTMLVQVSWCALRMSDSPFRETFAAIKAQRGANRALIAVAHKILRVIYALNATGTTFSPTHLKQARQLPKLPATTDMLAALSSDLKKSLHQRERDIEEQEQMAAQHDQPDLAPDSAADTASDAVAAQPAFSHADTQAQAASPQSSSARRRGRPPKVDKPPDGRPPVLDMPKRRGGPKKQP